MADNTVIMTTSLPHIGSCPARPSADLFLSQVYIPIDRAYENLQEAFHVIHPSVQVCEKNGDTYFLIDSASLKPDSGRLIIELATLQVTASRERSMLAEQETGLLHTRQTLAALERTTDSTGSTIKRIGYSALWAMTAFGLVTDLFQDYSTWLTTRPGIGRSPLYRLKRFDYMRQLRARGGLCGPLTMPNGGSYWADLLSHEIRWPLILAVGAAGAIMVEQTINEKRNTARTEDMLNDPEVQRSIRKYTEGGRINLGMEDIKTTDVRGIMKLIAGLNMELLEISREMQKISGQLKHANLEITARSYQYFNRADLEKLDDAELKALSCPRQYDS